MNVADYLSLNITPEFALELAEARRAYWSMTEDQRLGIVSNPSQDYIDTLVGVPQQQAMWALEWRRLHGTFPTELDQERRLIRQGLARHIRASHNVLRRLRSIANA